MGAKVEKIYIVFFTDGFKTFKLMARGGTLSTHTHSYLHGPVTVTKNYILNGFGRRVMGDRMFQNVYNEGEILFN